MCCNQNRVRYTNENKHAQKGMIKVILVGNTPIAIHGDISGRTYKFRKIKDSNWVDARDVVSMKEIKGLQILY